MAKIATLFCSKIPTRYASGTAQPNVPTFLGVLYEAMYCPFSYQWLRHASL
jgi:hypothetical protein